MRRRRIQGVLATVAAVAAGSVIMGQVHHKKTDDPTEPASPWSRPVHIGGRGAVGSPGGTHPLATDGKTVYATWFHGGKIHLRRSTDGGVTWGHAAAATDGGTAMYPCSLEVSGSALHLIWPDTRRLGLWEPYYKRSTDGGKSWGKAVRLSPGADLFRMGTAVSGSSVHLLWFNKHVLEKVPAGDQTWTWTWGEIYYQRSIDGGVTWSKPVRLSKPESSACRPSVAARGKYVHVTWLDNRDARQKPGWDWEIYYKGSADGGATWGPEVLMSRNAWHSRHPQILAAPGGRVCCIWEDGMTWDGRTSSGWSGDGAMYAAVSKDGGKTWAKPKRISFVNSPNGRATHAKSAADGKRFYLVWTDVPAGSGAKDLRARAAYYAMSADAGETWSPAERLAAGMHGDWAPNGVIGTESGAVVLLSGGGAMHASYRRAPTTRPAGEDAD